MTTAKLIRAALFAAPAALLFAAPAQAQVTSVATAVPEQVVLQSKAYKAAMEQINRDYAADFTSMQKSQEDFSKLYEPTLTKWDTNNDGAVDPQEQQAASKSDKANFDKWDAARKTLATNVNKTRIPSLRAELFALENILKNYTTARDTVVKARKIGAILDPNVFQWFDKATDINPLILAEVDKIGATVSTTPPATWQPLRSTVAFNQQLEEIIQSALQAQAAQAAAAQQQGQPGAQPATSQPAKPQPAKPQPQQSTPSR